MVDPTGYYQQGHPLDSLAGGFAGGVVADVNRDLQYVSNSYGVLAPQVTSVSYNDQLSAAGIPWAAKQTPVNYAAMRPDDSLPSFSETALGSSSLSTASFDTSTFIARERLRAQSESSFTTNPFLLVDKREFSTLDQKLLDPSGPRITDVRVLGGGGKGRADLAEAAEIQKLVNKAKTPGEAFELQLGAGALALRGQTVQGLTETSFTYELTDESGRKSIVLGGEPSTGVLANQALILGPKFLGGPKAAPAVPTTSSSAIRQRVLANIAESQAARQSSNFGLHIARESQIGFPYGGVDDFGFTVLNEGSIVYGGVPGQSAFYTDFATVRASRLNAQTLFESLQVAPHPVYGYRPAVQAYRVTKPVRIPTSEVLANPQFGRGGGTQFYIHDFEFKLEAVRQFPLAQ